MNDMQICIEGVSHTYRNGTKALDNISLNIGPGLFGLLGANGAGKSTLMRILSTLQQPGSGTVTLNGFNVVTQSSQVRSILGYLPQEFGAWRQRTVAEALDTFAQLSGLSDRRLRAARVGQTLDAVGLGQITDRKVKALSGGMLRRLGVAQALVHDPKIIIMDEPTVGLDPEERLRFRKLMADLSRDRIVMLSTHIVADLGASCSHIAMIDSGQLKFHGSPAQLIAAAEGQVFEMQINTEQIQQLDVHPDLEIVARSVLQGKHLVRFVARPELVLPQAGYAANITLEEAHIAFSMANGCGTRLRASA